MSYFSARFSDRPQDGAKERNIYEEDNRCKQKDIEKEKGETNVKVFAGRGVDARI